MSVTITDNTTAVNNDVQRKSGVFLRRIVDSIVADSTPKTPRRKGDLRQNILKQVLGTKAAILWRQKYANIQEKKQFRNYTTAGTGPHFAENAVRKGIKDTAIHAREAGISK